MNFKKLLIFSLILLVLSVSAVSAADLNETHEAEPLHADDSSLEIEDLNSEPVDIPDSVNVTVNAEKLSAKGPGSFGDLQKEVNAAPAGSTIYLERDYKGAEKTVVYINKDLTIDGQGHTIDCLGLDKCMAFSSEKGSIVLKNIKIINGHNDAWELDNNGGAIIITGSAEYIIENCVFENNYADDNGGAIYAKTAKNLTIINCLFKNNKADDFNGGAIASEGEGELIIYNSKFENNKACECGGAIYCHGKLTAVRSSFNSNEASNNIQGEDTFGGALYLGNNDGYIINSTFKDNFAQIGGAIYNRKDTLYINWQINSTTSTTRFINNKAEQRGGALCSNAIFANNCHFEGNVVDRTLTSKGGAIFSTESTFINNCTFKKNWSDDYGGAIYARSVYINTVITMNQTGTSYFIDNTADDDKGGAIYTEWGTYAVNAKFSGNKAETDGGAIYAEGKVEATNCLFDSNNAKGGSSCYGGAILAKGDAIIENSTFKNNYANDYGGAIYAGEVYINTKQEKTRPFNSFFINNKVKNDKGGAIFTDGEVVVMNAKFTGNIAEVDGGAIYAESNVKTINCLFDSNCAYGASSQCYGGAIRTEKDATIENCTYQNNYADDYGGAIYAKNVYIDTKQDKTEPFSSFFINNRAGDDNGGAIYSEGKISAKNTVFSKNIAVDYGGAAYAKDEVGFAHCLFEYNTANNKAGGAIYTKNDAVIDNCTFNKNWANKEGGAIYADIITLGNPSFFEYNTAHSGHGGAINVNKFNNDVTYAVFNGNKAGEDGTYDGGAIYINNENHVTFSKCQFINNHCSGEGGAIYMDSTGSDLALVQNIFIGNSAKEGQAVFNKGTFKKINNNYWNKNPNDGNDVVVEWTWIGSNKHHADSDPLKLVLTISKDSAEVNETVRATLSFVRNNGSYFTGIVCTEGIDFILPLNVRVVSMEKGLNSVYIDFYFLDEGTFDIFAYLYTVQVSKTITVNPASAIE